MICKNNSFQNWVKTLNILNSLFLVSLLLVIYATFNLRDEKIPSLKAVTNVNKTEEILSFSFPQNMTENILPVDMTDLQASLKAYKIPVRPDQVGKERLYLSLNGRLHQISTNKIYLAIENESLYLSERKSSSYLTIDDINVDSLKITQLCHLKEPFSKILHKSYVLPLSYLESNEIIFKSPFSELINCEFLGLDKLRELGGDLSYLIRLNNKLYTLHEGDSLFFDEKWQLGISVNKEYAYIQKAQSDKISMQLWDKSDQAYKKIIINKRNLPKRNLRISDVVSDIRMRSKKQISLLVEKQKIFLDEKGVLVKRKGKWMHFTELLDDDLNEAYLILSKISANREVLINIIEKNRVILHNFKVPVSSGSFAKKAQSKG